MFEAKLNLLKLILKYKKNSKSFNQFYYDKALL